MTWTEMLKPDIIVKEMIDGDGEISISQIDCAGQALSKIQENLQNMPVLRNNIFNNIVP